jgi:hypothetical protein
MIIRCAGRIHASVSDDACGLIEVRCSRSVCTYPHRRAVVVHTIDLATGLEKSTSQPFLNPMKGKTQ